MSKHEIGAGRHLRPDADAGAGGRSGGLRRPYAPVIGWPIVVVAAVGLGWATWRLSEEQ